jgi:ribosome-associated protein
LRPIAAAFVVSFVRIQGLARRKPNKKAKEFAQAAARIAQERHCTDIVVLDLRGMSPATDYFVIATGTSERQRRTVADEVSQLARERKMYRFGRAGYEQGRWILVDFVDVVIHLFDPEYREFYDLELLWGDAEKVKF